MKGKGPDMFIQDERVSNRPIEIERWGNWDSYHHPIPHYDELSNKTRRGFKSRDTERYDPVTRTYKNWAHPNDWYHLGTGLVRDNLGRGLPRFTEEEQHKLNLQYRKGTLPRQASGWPDFDKVNLPTWDRNGPERFRDKYNWYWREAHRLVDPQGNAIGPNPNFRMNDRSWTNNPNVWACDERLWR